MYNYNELQAVDLSPTKKDYYQIWNELIEVASKLSTRWDPSATNESDPGIVLLKVLTAIADKINYNIDANTLEAFMPSAAQESSMRKLCEMLGYSMQYFKSATTSVRISYKGASFPTSGSIVIDRFTNIKDKNSTYNYVTNAKVILTPEIREAVVECLEGELVTCQTENGTTVTLAHLDDNNRFYLPEQQVASNDNCIFIARVDTPDYFWESTDNLNTCLLGTMVYKFGFDSNKALPYVQFPDDIGSLIGSGLTIRFLRTRGASGNIATRFLQSMEKPASWGESTVSESTEVSAATALEQEAEETTDWQDLAQYSITNLAPARNGRNPETIDEAYWNYQKTIGTFDTLVTCRDYMNKIYQMTFSNTDSTPLVSNIIVSDIRDDINRAYSVCTYTDQGLEYIRHAELENIGDTENPKYQERIQYFDLVLYPFQTVYGLNNRKEFENSFKYSSERLSTLIANLDANKSIAHSFIHPDNKDIVCLKVYFQLSARLATTSKVSALEALEIEQAAHNALYTEYNMRHVSFGEELPYDSILKTLTMADPRIKNVILDDPKMYINVCLKDGQEITIIGNQLYDTETEAQLALAYYKRLVLNNVLAGKISLFNFDETFATAFTDKVYADGNARVDSTKSLRLPTDTDTNPTTTSMAEIISGTKTHTFIETDSGTLSLSLLNSDSDANKLKSACHALGDIAVSLFAKGASEPTYTITFRPEYADTNTDTVPTSLISEIRKYENGSYIYINDADALSSLPFASYFSGKIDTANITLISDINFNDTANLDKVTVTAHYSYNASGTSELDTLAKEDLDKTELSFTWEPKAATIETIGYPTYFDPATAESYITLNHDSNTLKKNEEAMIEPTAIASNFEVYAEHIDAENPLVLEEHEVIQFRAPNFKTINTYPAYVNYYAKLDAGRVSGDSLGRVAIPATMTTLKQFFGGGATTEANHNNYNRFYQYIELDENEKPVNGTLKSTTSEIGGDAWNRRKSWERKINSMPSNCIRPIFTTTADSDIENAFSEVAAAKYNLEYDTQQENYGALFVIYDGSYRLFELPEAKPNEVPTDEAGNKLGLPSGITFYAVHLDDTNFIDFISWLRGQLGNSKTSAKLQYIDEEGNEIIGEKLITHVYSKGTSNLSRPVGKLVDQARAKYTAIESLVKTGYSALETYYVPQLYQNTTSDHTSDGLGRDATLVGLPANTEYVLGPDEYILLTYSTSEGREDGVTVVKNILLDKGTIVKANFALQDSAEKSVTSKFSKTANYGPWVSGDRIINIEEIPGMFTFGATEQLEVREQIQVKLNEPVTNLYWEVNSPQQKDGYEYFPFDDDGSYILQAGEYLFYTNETKESIVYYGAGSEIKKDIHTPTLRVKQADKTVSTELANEVGLAASLPWVPFDLSKDQAQLLINEYRVVNLAAGDTLKSVTFPDGTTTEQKHLNNKFTKIVGASYEVAGKAGDLPTLLLDDLSWEVRSKLELCLGPNTAQTLNVHRTIYGQEIARSFLTFKKDGQDLQTYTPLSDEASNPIPMAIYADQSLLGADGNYTFELDKDGKLKKALPKLKLCERAAVVAVSSDGKAIEDVSLAFDKNGFSACSLAAGDVTLNLTVPETDFSLVTFYIPKVTDSISENMRVTLTPTADTQLAIFNYLRPNTISLASVSEESIIGKFSWWNDKTDYELRCGLNTVVIPSSCTLTIHHVNPTSKLNTIYLGKAKLIPKLNQLNYQLAFESHNDMLDVSLDTRRKFEYKVEEDRKALTVQTSEVYDHIRALDPDYHFYYTHVPSNMQGLALNEFDSTDTLKEPKNWFDTQNTVNKFVVTELDAEYLSTYIAVSKFSRSQL